MENVNPPPTNNRLVLPATLHGKVVQELHELHAISALVDSRLESIEQSLNNFANQPNETDMNDIESDDESIDTPFLKFLIKMPLMRNMNINDVYERIMTRIEERLDQFVDQFADRMNDMMDPKRCRDRNGRRSKDNELENPFFKEFPLFDDDQYEDVIEEEEGFVYNYPDFQEDENNVSFSGVVLGVKVESTPVYDTDIEDVIEEEEGFVGKGGFCREEDNIEDVVVVASDRFSSMIQATLSVDFSKTINSNPHKLIWLQKGNFVEVSILIGKKYQEYLKAAPMDDKLGFKTIKVRGRVIIKKGNLMQGIQI
ncbi:hypothetical protein Tco_1452291 [Tanacetum coccineum]